MANAALLSRPTPPSNMLVSVEPKADNASLYRLRVSSEYAEEKLAERFLKLSWFAVLDEDNAGNRGKLFEAFVCTKLSQPIEWKIDRESLRGNQRKNYINSSQVFCFDSKRTIVRVTDPIDHVKAASKDKLFYSKNEFEPLIDMICRVDEGYFAVQVTIQKKHDAATQKIRSLVHNLDLQNSERLIIVYAVPKSRLADFETSPVNPLFQESDLAKKVVIYHLAIHV